MRGQYGQSARSLALDLLRGAKVEIVGGKALRGVRGGTSPQYMEVDGMAVHVPRPEFKEASGVRAILPDGFVPLYVVSTHERACELLADAEEIVQSIPPKADLASGQEAPH